MAAAQIGLHVNEIETEFMSYNKSEDDLIILHGRKLNQVNDFLYLWSRIESTENDLNVRIAIAWTALNKREAAWDYDLNKSIKVDFFRAVVQTVLLYRSNAWTLVC